MIKLFKEFFSFSKKELNGLLVFSILLVLIAFAPLIYQYFTPQEKYDYSAFAKEVQRFRASAKEKEKYAYHSYVDEAESGPADKSPQLFTFNPNGLSAQLWKKLGLNERQIRVIKNFEAKGGKFYQKEDLKKIYSIRPEEYSILEPYISIPQRTYPPYSKTPYERKPAAAKPLKIIEINSADSTELETISGIGPAFASRIIRYRSRLGGFYNKEQLKEVYGLDSVMYQKVQNQIDVNQSAIQPISINTATFNDLKKHPYLTYKQMNAILQYRKQHGPYKTLNDLKGIVILNEEVLNKIAPYISFK